MSDYTQVNDYSAKDALASGDPAKKIKGSDIDAELSAIATAIASKSGDAENNTVSGNWTFSGNPSFTGATTGATQAQMEAETAGKIVTADVAKHHPGAAKAWIDISADQATINASYNISSYTDTGTGDGIANFTTAFSSGNFAILHNTMATVGDGNANHPVTLAVINGSSAVRLVSANVGPAINTTYADIRKSLVAFGDQ